MASPILIPIQQFSLCDRFLTFFFFFGWIRRTLTTVQKQAYIAAVQCILTKPALTPKSVAAGAVSRYDDLVVTHVQQFNKIHFTVNFSSLLLVENQR